MSREAPPELAAALAPLVDTSERTEGELDTSLGDARYLAVPVEVGGERGALAAAALIEEERNEVDSAVLLAAGVGAVVILLSAGFMWIAAGRTLLPLRSLARTTRAITETDLSERVDVSGRDELAQLGRTFNSMLDRLELAFADQKGFLADVGHELRTPITVIRGYLDTLGDDPAERREALAVIRDELERMSRLVDDLLLLARSDRPGFLRPEPIDLDLLTNDLFAKARLLGDRRWTLEGVGVGVVVADPHRLTSAVMNLAQNAVRHTRGDQMIAIGSEISGAEARICVRDEGAGIEPAEQARIFERFERGGNEDAGPGSGLGLAIVRAVAEAHGGAGRARIGARGGRPLHDRHPRGRSGDGGGLSMARILIAEDEPRLVAFLEKGLRASGFSTTVATDGIAAGAIAATEQFDLVILDLGLPGKGGLDVLRDLRAANDATPVIVLTARDDTGDRVAGLEAGADDYLGKPFDLEELIARIRVRLRGGGGRSEDEHRIEVGPIAMDVRTRWVSDGGEPVELSAREFELLRTFLERPNQALSREQLLAHVWGYDYDPGSNVVDVYVGYLRRKLGADRFETVRSVGYRFRA